MYRDKISLTEAMSLELIGDITIVDTSPESLSPYPEVGQKWKDAFTLLQAKHRHISPEKLLNFVSAKYLIEINEGVVDKSTNTFMEIPSWGTKFQHTCQVY